MQPSLRRLSRIRLPFATTRRLGTLPNLVSNSKAARKERTFSSLAPWRQADETTSSVAEPEQPSHLSKNSLIRALPLSCPGCGAPSQTVAPDLAGYYSADMNHVKAYLKRDQEPELPKKREDDIYAEAVAKLDPSLREQLGVTESTNPPPKPAPPPPLCNRCHRLMNHREGVPIDHPSIKAIKAMIQESPHKRNCIYHVVDAADFPMSVIPDITRALDLSPLRSRGRRASKSKWQDGKHSHVEFIITRADLLVPQEDMSRRLMAYIIDVLREKIGREYRDNVRLGNVHLVSAKRGWWTSAVKQEILERGGASWFVGKVNVGKSSLFEVVFPKGKKDYVDVHQLREQAEKDQKKSWDTSDPAPKGKDTELDTNLSPKVNQEVQEVRSESNEEDPTAQAEEQTLEASENEAKVEDIQKDTRTSGEETAVENEFDAQALEKNGQQAKSEISQAENPDAGLEENTKEDIDLKESPSAEQDYTSFSETSLLPPPRKEVDYPVMPIISHLPGTTASPIRIPFARGRGELIDLPGLDRAGMDQYVAPQHRSKLLLNKRHKTERIVLKAHESLVLGGGLVRITPATTDLVYLVHPFVELPWHKCSTNKAVARERGKLENERSGVKNWADEAARRHMRSAGVVPLAYDVTKTAAGPLVRKDVTRLKADNLPFVVWAVDVLIEGLGWVEVTAQTRRFRGKIHGIEEAADAIAGKKRMQGEAGEAKASETEAEAKTGDDAAAAQQPHETAAASPEAEQQEDASATPPSPEPSSEPSPDADTDAVARGPEVQFPQIHVFSPHGACIGTRRPLMGSVLNAPQKARPKERPRQSMKAVKARRPKGTQPGEKPDTVARGVRRPW
ncbi:uncharacterized protein J3D65DRAFT_608730 [Phyllosticta citribraziliensis]|uniref:Uncharacterized protein n=1 Tax=Phyllosticta citribraziliensis TaxID=989973 RepID=A0ABR1M8H0_9PEZI